MTITIPAGTIGFLVSSKKKISPKVRVNTPVTVEVIRTEKRGTGEFEKTDYIVMLDGKQVAIPSQKIN